MTRNEKAKLHKELITLLTANCEDDDKFFQHLLYALNVISNELQNFTNETEK